MHKPEEKRKNAYNIVFQADLTFDIQETKNAQNDNFYVKLLRF
jgi:hypothetical protein